MSLEQDWNPLAKELGYVNEYEMLKDMYETLLFSVREIAKVVGCSNYCVRKHLVDHGIKLRGRGGPQNQNKRKLININLEELFMEDAEELAAKYDLHSTSVYRERRLRKQEWISESAQ